MNEPPHPLVPDEIEAVTALARVVWQATYPALISQAQIDAMLADRYAAPLTHTHGTPVLRLQVNRGNTQAIRAYEKYGFRIVESRVFDIGEGFVMDDHVMELTP